MISHYFSSDFTSFYLFGLAKNAIPDMFSRIFDAEIVSLAAAEIRSEAAGRGDMCGC